MLTCRSTDLNFNIVSTRVGLIIQFQNVEKLGQNVISILPEHRIISIICTTAGPFLKTYLISARFICSAGHNFMCFFNYYGILIENLKMSTAILLEWLFWWFVIIVKNAFSTIVVILLVKNINHKMKYIGENLNNN